MAAAEVSDRTSTWKRTSIERPSSPLRHENGHYDRVTRRLSQITEAAKRWIEIDGPEGGVVDLLEGCPDDPPNTAAIEAAKAALDNSVYYPDADGAPAFLHAVSDYLARRFGVVVPVEQIVASSGTFDTITFLPHILKLRDPSRDTVLVPPFGFHGYATGATVAGARVAPVPLGSEWRIELDAIDQSDADRAMMLFVNSPHNPTGTLADLERVAEWGRANGVLVVCDEVYAEQTFAGPPRSILQHGTQGVLALHSLSKRSNMRGMRIGFCAGDEELTSDLAYLRQSMGWMPNWASQAAGRVALADDDHAEQITESVRGRLMRIREILLQRYGVESAMPEGGPWLFVRAPGDMNGQEFAEQLAADAGIISFPGVSFGLVGDSYTAHQQYLRVSAGATMERINLAARRLGLE